MRAPKRPDVKGGNRKVRGLFVLLLCAPGCADIWGFQDLTRGNDASVLDAGVDGSETDGRVAAADGAAGDDAHVGDAGQRDAAAEAAAIDGGTGPEQDAAGGEGGCGPTDTILSCGTCNQACDTKNSLDPSCNGTSCEYGRCAEGWEDCDPSPPDTDGCETQTGTIQHCGGCAACDKMHSNGASCNGTTCLYMSCKAGYADCDQSGADTNGCETPVPADTCAICGAPGCDMVNSTGGSCVVSDAGVTCTYTGCRSGFDDCNKSPPDINGCETSLTTIANCGACGRACDTKTSQDAGCTDAGCAYGGCDPGWANCDTNPPDTNGCETSLKSVLTCGACKGAACDTTTGTPSCDGTTCSYQCLPGRADCSHPSPNLDGCECDTPTCCGAQCAVKHTDGIGQAFYDCTALGTYDQGEAAQACKASGARGCLPSSKCCLLSALGSCLLGDTVDSVCGIVGNTCYCWQYTGSYPGTLQTMSASSCSASCGSSTDPTWK